MIDTIRVGTSFPLGTKFTEGEKWWQYRANDRFGPIFTTYRTLDDGVRFEFQSHQYEEPSLYCEVSLPRLLFGHNVGILDKPEINRALDRMGEIISRMEFTQPVPDFETFQVFRFDSCYAWRVDSPSDIVDDLARHIHKRRTAGTYEYQDHETDGSTVSVKQWALDRKFYDKESEVRSHLVKRADGRKKQLALDSIAFAEGVLRYETVNKSGRIHRTLMPNGRTVADLRKYVDTKLEDRLREDIIELTKDWAPSNATIVYKKLRATFEKNEIVNNRFMLWATLSQIGVARYRKLETTNKKVLSRHQADLRKAGVGLGSLKGAEKLEVPSSLVVWARDLILPLPGEDMDLFPDSL